MSLILVIMNESHLIILHMFVRHHVIRVAFPLICKVSVSVTDVVEVQFV